MSSGCKRIAKRSILGTRVSVPLESGFYVSGVIQRIRSVGAGDETCLYSVQFDSKVTSASGHRRSSAEFSAAQMIGPGFGHLSKAVSLLPQQKVYITFNGREVSASVVSHSSESDQVFLAIDSIPNMHNKDSLLSCSSSSFPIQIKRRLEDIRLLASRKSARLQEVDTDYARIAFGSMDIRKRSSSMSSSNSWTSIDFSTDEGIEIDESSLPKGLQQSKKANQRIIFICLWPGCGLTYHACRDVERHVRQIHLGRPDRKEKQREEQCPEGDEDEEDGDDHEEEFYYTEIEVDESSTSSSGVSLPSESPVSSLSMFSPPFTSTDSESTNQSPILSPMLRETDLSPFMNSSSAPTLSHMDMARPPHEDPTYQRSLAESAKHHGLKVISSPINIPGIGCSPELAAWKDPPLPTTTVINSIEMRSSAPPSSAPFDSRSSRTTVNGSKFMRLSGSNKCKMGTTLLQPSHKGIGGGGGHPSAAGKRSRGESRKCRKVYGMDSRDNWCTQCKWKKACTRFVD